MSININYTKNQVLGYVDQKYGKTESLTTEIKISYEVSTGKVGTALPLVAPVKEGHMFLGWYTNPEFTGEKVTFSQNDSLLNR